jgi:hypothetical protein
MQLTIYVNGLTFKSKSSRKMTAEKAKDVFYAQFEKMNKVEMELDDGGFLIIGEQALQNAVLVFGES